MFGDIAKREERVTVRFTGEEKALVEKLAKAEGLSMAEYIRLLIQKELK